MVPLPPLRSVSYGGGTQSTALLVLAAQRRIPFDLFLFANTGDDSEDERTLEYVHAVAMPYAAAHDIELRELHRHRRDGSIETLHGRLTNPDLRSMPIPYRSTKDGPPMSRSCTADFKVRVIAKELRRRGATVDEPALVALGISTDELVRAKPGPDPEFPQIRTYPLLLRSPLDPYSSGLRMSRHQCVAVIAEAGLPVPPKSACWFCPHHDGEAWAALKRRRPDRFEAACELEEHMAAKSGVPVFLTRKGVPLRSLYTDDQLSMFEDDGCESGYCMT